MQDDPFTSAKVLAEKVGISVRKIETNIRKLKDLGYIKRIGPAKGGRWKIIEQD
jgi:ATP-dependent DNA helicase RecG